MRRIEARRKNARPLAIEVVRSLASLRLRLSHAHTLYDPAVWQVNKFFGLARALNGMRLDVGPHICNAVGIDALRHRLRIILRSGKRGTPDRVVSAEGTIAWSPTMMVCASCTQLRRLHHRMGEGSKRRPRGSCAARGRSIISRRAHG